MTPHYRPAIRSTLTVGITPEEDPKRPHMPCRRYPKANFTPFYSRYVANQPLSPRRRECNKTAAWIEYTRNINLLYDVKRIITPIVTAFAAQNFMLAEAEELHCEVETTGWVCVDDDKIGRMGFQTLPNHQNQAVGFQRRENHSNGGAIWVTSLWKQSYLG